MDGKYLIFGATGSIGSSLANQLHNSKHDIHLVARNEEEVKWKLCRESPRNTFPNLLKDFMRNGFNTTRKIHTGIVFPVSMDS